MNSKQIEAFLLVADLKSFTEAAKQLYMSQPAVSFQIKSLEDELNVSLFERTDKKVYLTEAGQILYPTAKDIVSRYHKVLEDIDSLKGLKTGYLNIGASTIPGEYILPFYIKSFGKIYPGIKISLRVGGSGNVVNWVSNKEVALGITGTKVERKDLECKSWIEDELVLIAPASSYWNSRREIKLTELKDHPLIMRETTSGTRKTIEVKLWQKGIYPEQCNVVMEIGSSRSVITAVQAGLGLSFVSRWAAKESLELSRIVEVKIAGLNLKRELYLVRNTKALGGGFAAGAFMEFVKENKN